MMDGKGASQRGEGVFLVMNVKRHIARKGISVENLLTSLVCPVLEPQKALRLGLRKTYHLRAYSLFSSFSLSIWLNENEISNEEKA